MTKEEVFKKITSDFQWYQGYCTSGYASTLQKKFPHGLIGEKAIDRLFEHFGYKKITEQWEKK